MVFPFFRKKCLSPAKRTYFTKVAPLLFRLIHIRSPRRYCIMQGYHHRHVPRYLDTKSSTDEWQREVYLQARQYMNDNELSVVYDIGCGSGFKLIEYLGNFYTIGFDVAETVEFLQTKYPQRQWRVISFEDYEIPKPDLVICADVIEHVDDPDRLTEFICRLNPQYAIFSTPDRELCYRYDDPARFGPPRNLTHLREWNFAEFGKYISERFEIIEHVITNTNQGTQMIISVPKKRRTALSTAINY
jgi:SAM-dependent methyltransferase